MSLKTTYYGMFKPELTDPANITELNQNFDTIDEELHKRASLDENGKVLSSQLPAMDYVPTSQKAKPNGVATLGNDGKVPKEQLPDSDEASGAASTIQKNNLTPNRAVIANADGKIGVSPTTSTEIGYLSGLKSNAQTQLDNKVPKSGGQLTGALTFENLDEYRAIGKSRTVNGSGYYMNVGCGVLGGEGCSVTEVYIDGDTMETGSRLARLEISRLGVSYIDENNVRTYLMRSGAVPASIEN